MSLNTNLHRTDAVWGRHLLYLLYDWYRDTHRVAERSDSRCKHTGESPGKSLHGNSCRTICRCKDNQCRLSAILLIQWDCTLGSSRIRRWPFLPRIHYILTTAEHLHSSCQNIMYFIWWISKAYYMKVMVTVVYNCLVLHLTAMECHLPYGITVLPSTRHKWTHPP